MTRRPSLLSEEPTPVSDSPTIVFDLNGDAADSDPVCVASVGEAIPTGYNNATISVSLPTGAVAAVGVCGYVLPAFDSGRMTLTVSFASGGDSITREYPLAPDPTPEFVSGIAADDFDWFSPDLVVWNAAIGTTTALTIHTIGLRFPASICLFDRPGARRIRGRFTMCGSCKRSTA